MNLDNKDGIYTLIRGTVRQEQQAGGMQCYPVHCRSQEGHARKSIFGPNPAFSAFTKAAMLGCVLYKLEAKLSRSLE